MKNNYLFLAVLIFITFYMLKIGCWTPPVIEGFNFQEFILQITRRVEEARRAAIHLKKPDTIPPDKIWVCDSQHTGKAVLGRNLKIDCSKPNSLCDTEDVINKTCRYKPLPSSTWNTRNKNRFSETEKEIAEENLSEDNIYIPPTVNTCKRGCVLADDTSNGSIGASSSYRKWKCDAESSRDGIFTNTNNTSVYSSSDICKYDSDCVWCNNTGFTPVDLRSYSEIQAAIKKSESQY